MTGCCAKTTPAVALVDGWVRIVSRVLAPGLTVIDGLVFGVFDGCVRSEAVSVWLGAVFRVMLNSFVPATRELVTATAAGSLGAIFIESVTVFTRFQLASTALTVALKAVPAFCVAGVPVLPFAVPGAAISPGASNCSLVKAATLTVVGEIGV